jgi:hypothetical protein
VDTVETKLGAASYASVESEEKKDFLMNLAPTIMALQLGLLGPL